jgi:hypothetical protein
MTDTTGTEVAESELADSMGAEGVGGDIAAALAIPDPQPVYAALAACPIMVLPGDINVVGAAASVDALTATITSADPARWATRAAQSGL